MSPAQIQPSTGDLSLRNEPLRFLDLPGEIRNAIYEYALSMDGGLTANCDVARPLSRNNRPAHFFRAKEQGRRDHNQLKYVCKQLRAETAGLGIRYNDLTFRGGQQMTGFELMKHFANNLCSSERVSRIRKVVIIDTTLSTSTPRRSVNSFSYQVSKDFPDFARAHPLIKFEVRLHGFGSATPLKLWMITGGSFQLAIRNTIPEWFYTPELQGLGHMCEYHRSIAFSKDYKCPDNVRYFPGKNYRKTGWGTWGTYRSVSEKGRNALVWQCHQWFKEGF